MTEAEKIYNFIGLAMRAGKLTSGYDVVANDIERDQVKLLIIAKDISRNTLDRIFTQAERYEDIYQKSLECFFFGDMKSLGDAIGRKPRGVMAITDEGFANKLSEMLSNYDEETKEDV